MPILSRDEGRQVELVTGNETVVIFAEGDGGESARAAVKALEPMPSGSSPSDLPAAGSSAGAGDERPKNLEPPAAGAFDGTISCE